MRRTQIIAGVLFIVLLSIGLRVASQRPLWNDEYNSVMSSIKNISYYNILRGGIDEGNNFPLFYILQKCQWDIFSYHPPQEWATHWEGRHVYDWIFLRIQSVFFTSAALSALFYYFSRRFSLLAASYALALALSSSVIWGHWCECRPYALLFALSIFQMLFLLDMLQTPRVEDKDKVRYLILIHCLLALTSSTSAVQIIAAGCVLGIGRRSWKLFLPMVLLPLGIILFYYSAAPKYNFFFINGPVSLISANFPKERFFLTLIFAVLFIYDQRGQKKWMMKPEISYLAFMTLMLAFFAVVLVKLKISSEGSQHGFQVPGRYFMSLAPMSIIGTTIFSIYLIGRSKSRLWQAGVVVCLAALLAFRIHKMV